MPAAILFLLSAYPLFSRAQFTIAQNIIIVRKYILAKAVSGRDVFSANMEHLNPRRGSKYAYDKKRPFRTVQYSTSLRVVLEIKHNKKDYVRSLIVIAT